MSAIPSVYDQTAERSAVAADAAVAAHVAQVNPHTQYTTEDEVNALAAAAAEAAVGGHEGEPDPHNQYQMRTEKGDALGYASLDAAQLVVENPASATTTPGVGKIPVSDGSGKLDGWVSAASTSTAGRVQLATSGEASATKAVTGTDSRLSDSRAPTSHASSHQNGGSDEVATATPGANAIPKANSSAKLAAGWIDLGGWRSTSSSTDTLTAADGTVEYSVSCIVTLPAASACQANQHIKLIASAPGVTLQLRRAGSDTIDGGTADVPVLLPVARAACAVVCRTSSAWGSVQPGALTATQATRAVISVLGGAWVCSLQARNSGGSYSEVGTAAVETEVDGGEITLADDDATLAIGVAATTTPSSATTKWRVPISALTGFDNSNSRSMMSIDVLPGIIPAATNQYLWLAFASPTGTFDSTAENRLGGQIGRGATNPTTRRATLAGTWTTITSGASLTRLIFHYRPGMSSMTMLSCNSTTPPPTHEQATTTDTTSPTHIYWGIASSVLTVATAAYTPTIILDWS